MKKIIALGPAGTLAAASVGATTSTAEAAKISPAGAAVAGVFIGLALGSILAHPHGYASYSSYPGYYYPDYPVYPSYAVDDHVGWCAAHYRSYQPTIDAFLGYDGLWHRCVSPY